MKTLKQHYIVYKNEKIDEEFDVTVLFAETGYLARKGSDANEGIVISLGTNDTTEYYEVEGEKKHDVPETLPDITIYNTDDEEAELEDFVEALEDLGV